MQTDKLINILKAGSITLPILLVRNYHKLNISCESLIVLAYLIDKGNVLDYKKIAKDLNIDDKLILNYINELQEKGLLVIKVQKNDKGVMEEHLSFDSLYSKWALLLIEDGNKDLNGKLNLYQVFEQEFGRTLSSMEYQIINGWLEAKHKEEIILAALKEAIFNGASSLRYIDKILFEWHKKGIKKVSDIAKEKEKFIKSRSKKIKIEDYNWLEDNDKGNK